MDNSENKSCLQKLSTFLPCFLIIGIVTVLVGIVFLSTSQDTIVKKERIVDYTNCEAYGAEEEMTCLEYMKKYNDSCVCYKDFNISEQLYGNITFFYELESFDQLRSDYVNSRDNNQLNGIMNLEPSDKCEPFRYANTLEGKKPIAPCGAIADAMFSDTFRFKYMDTELGTYVPTLDAGMLSDADKQGYRNPDNISAFENFVQPESWDLKLLKLSQNNENNGFKGSKNHKTTDVLSPNRPNSTRAKLRTKNERFISWMKTEWKQKPFAILNQTEEKFKMGLPIGKYELRVGYNYPTYRYDGLRKIIIIGKDIHSYEGWFLCGVVALIIGSVLLTVAVGLIIMKLKHPEKVPQQEAAPLRN